MIIAISFEQQKNIFFSQNARFNARVAKNANSRCDHFNRHSNQLSVSSPMQSSLADKIYRLSDVLWRASSGITFIYENITQWQHKTNNIRYIYRLLQYFINNRRKSLLLWWQRNSSVLDKWEFVRWTNVKAVESNENGMIYVVLSMPQEVTFEVQFFQRFFYLCSRCQTLVQVNLYANL